MNQNKILINQILINPSSVARLLGVVAFFLIVASIGGLSITYITGHNYGYGFIPLFDVDREQNLPTYFSSFLLLFSAMLLLIITILERNRKAPYASKWAVLSFCFLCIAVDEVISMHEMLSVFLREWLSALMLKQFGLVHLGIFYYPWVIPAIIVVFIFAIFFLRFFLHLKVKIRNYFLIAATLYLGGAVGLELIEGYYFESLGVDFTFRMLTNVEECLEMVGIIVFIWGLLTYMSDNFKTVQFHFTSVVEYSPTDTKVDMEFQSKSNIKVKDKSKEPAL